MKLTIGTYNVCHCADFSLKDGDKLPVNIAKIAALISKTDITGANELYQKSDNFELQNQTEKLAAASGHKYFEFGLGTEFSWGDSIGNAVLSKYPIVSVEKIAVLAPTESEKRPNENDWYEDRIIVKATVDIGRKIDYISTHFGLNLLEQERMVKKLTEIIDESENPVVLCGDFNATPHSDILKPLYERLTSAADVVKKTNEFTLDSFNPYITLDYIFLSKEFKVISYDVIKEIASDHFPIRAEVEI